ncbi:hypothetical protein QTP88_017385 [Uroleucon formosanum]
MEPTSNIINECTSGLSQAGKEEFTADGALKKQIRRTRRKIQAAPDALKDLISLIIPVNYQSYSPSEGVTEQFLLHDSGPEVDRNFIFCRPQNLNILSVFQLTINSQNRSNHADQKAWLSNPWILSGRLPVPSKERIRYLDIELSKKLGFVKHLECANAKAIKKTSSLARLISNISGTKRQTRRNYSFRMSVTQSLGLAPDLDTI